ncbi:hypothetical protein [Azospirillum sp. TSO5]|uniref:hypothetical protein n=1 Tax=Azospirillum sp. TSO5 TaxID=716760 RepID=UPI000D607F96|nr:hypothetical protein [Azospirillum sp. TSO5]PWC92889.1 hypothetical protein TSO5_15790 [Azospirillum sp. TSO5]
MAKAKTTRKAAEETGFDRLLVSLKGIDAMIVEWESERDEPADTRKKPNEGLDDPFDFGAA